MNYWFLYLLTTGEIYTSPYLGNANEWTNIPDGCGVLGPIDEATASEAIKDAYLHPNYYFVQSGSLVAVTNLAQLQLQDAQTTKIASLQVSFQQTLNAGFPSLASGTSITYGFSDLDQTNLSQELNILNAGIAPLPIQWGAKDGVTIVSLTDVQFKQLCKDANDFKWSLITKLRTLIGDVQASTTVDAVNAIVW